MHARATEAAILGTLEKSVCTSVYFGDVFSIMSPSESQSDELLFDSDFSDVWHPDDTSGESDTDRRARNAPTTKWA
jgi:hypothetical protein